MFTYQFGGALSLPQVDRIRWHLFPEVRVHSPVQPELFGSANAASNVIEFPDLIRVMDMQQEQLARSLGDGHRVIHGVAGSGKTMILGYRCLQLARSLSKPILVLCFNRTLAARLSQVIQAHQLEAQVTIRSFHSWCAQMLQTYHVANPRGGGTSIYEGMVTAVIDAVDRGVIPRAQYGAVLIDEGHDFEPEWLSLIVQMVDPLTNSLLLLYDDAQSIYAKRTRRAFSFASVGVQARGRTTILKFNYRNSWEVLAVAKAFAAELFDGESLDEDAPDAIAPESVGRHGKLPRLISCASRREEATMIAAQIGQLLGDGVAPNQIAVLWQHWYHVDAIASELSRCAIDMVSARDRRGKDQLFLGKASVKLVSMHSSKGLEFDHVFIPGLDRMPGTGDDEASIAKLLYVAMTRAMHTLTLTSVGNTGFVDKIEAAINVAKTGVDDAPHDLSVRVGT